MYWQLTCFGMFVFLLPTLFIPDYSYITTKTVIGGFPFTTVRHDVLYHGIQFFFCLLFIAISLFFAGLVNPKISLWFGKKTRQRSSTVYGIVVVIAILGFAEVKLISSYLYELEDGTMVSFYEGIAIGSSMDEVQKFSRSLNKNLRHSVSLADREKDLIAYDQTRNVLEFTFPNQFRTRRVIVETNLRLDDEDARVIGKYLLIDNRIAKSEF